MTTDLKHGGTSDTEVSTGNKVGITQRMTDIGWHIRCDNIQKSAPMLACHRTYMALRNYSIPPSTGGYGVWYTNSMNCT